MRRLLLISNSTSHGSGYLDHCEDEIRRFLGEGIRKVLFIPYANTNRDDYSAKVKERFSKMGYDVVSIHDQMDKVSSVREAEAIFIGGGNTFHLIGSMYEDGIISEIRSRVFDGAPYIGTSAGSNVACSSIRTTNDMPIVYPPSFDAIGLVPFNLNPHYIDPDPGSTHKGETRKQRIDQFHELNETPVIGLRESAMLLIEGDKMLLKGPSGAMVFQKRKETIEFEPGSDLSFLLHC